MEKGTVIIMLVMLSLLVALVLGFRQIFGDQAKKPGSGSAVGNGGPPKPT